jgi:catechol 2,3-dioxygenase-like lactoylglutathione lyase family enzyme
MLSDHPAHATIPTADISSLRRFYEDVLGFAPRDENPSAVFYDAGRGTYFIVTRSDAQDRRRHCPNARWARRLVPGPGGQPHRFDRDEPELSRLSRVRAAGTP